MKSLLQCIEKSILKDSNGKEFYIGATVYCGSDKRSYIIENIFIKKKTISVVSFSGTYDSDIFVMA